LKESNYEQYMLRALHLALRAAGKTSPNPLVGAVIVKSGEIVGEGYHRRAGLPHAEIEALREAGREARGAELYVNLEPCRHYGRTPPCTDALIAAGVRKVIVGMRDPNPLVSGKGIRSLRRAGIEVVCGILRAECERANEVFIKYIRDRVPFAILKAAISLDGKIATRLEESKWISSPASRKRAHELRSRVDAVMAGAGTVAKDNPRLTARVGGGKTACPARVILDHEHIVPLAANVFRNAARERVIYAAGRNIPPAREKALRKMGVDVCFPRIGSGGIDLRHMMRLLGERRITSVLIEGGSRVNASALRDRVVDKIVFFVAPMIIGGGDAVGVVGGEGIGRLRDAFKIKKLAVGKCGPDLVVEGYL
jgi:diaminohydroxyphosphoribosylaminopyrimidine deaminase/5-amino-6-(5-phosphoribosylamino)uracil reductase